MDSRYADDLMSFQTFREELFPCFTVLAQKKFPHWMAVEWHENENLDEAYLTRGTILY